MSGVATYLLLTVASGSAGQIPSIRNSAYREPESNAVLAWNQAALQVIRAERTPPPKAARALAMASAAVFDAVNAVEPRYESYLTEAVAAPGTSAEAAACAAAHRVLAALFPNQRERLDNFLADTLARIPAGPGQQQGIDLGRLVADRMLEWRRNDGADRIGSYQPKNRPGAWTPTLPTFQQALLPAWGGLATFGIRPRTVVEPPAPPLLSSREYLQAFDEVKTLGGVNSRIRTAEQTEIAKFWADDVGTVTPPGHWNQIAQTYARESRLSLLESARLFALLNISLGDASVLCWVLKFTHEFWRPITGIRQADLDGNPDTAPDAQWSPLLTTPPFPAYTSGHSTFSAAGAASLASFHRSDRFAFITTSDGLPGVRRSFSGFWEAAEEAGMSRIYGGIHWRFDNVEGLRTGRSIAEFVSRSYLRPR